jgi:transposase-like protein
MKHTQDIQCSHCLSSDLQKNGHSENGTQRWFCNDCRKSFQLSYRYNARKPGVKEQITELTLNSSGVRDIGRILGIHPNTVVAELKKNATCEPIRY